jgi:hypothetical protein
MRKAATICILIIFLLSNIQVSATTVNEADTELSETLTYALINSLREPIDEAISQIYKSDKNAPSYLTWATYDTKLIKIKQVYGIGGLYELTLQVHPYYGAHNSYGVDEVVINTEGEVINYKHLKTYHKAIY